MSYRSTIYHHIRTRLRPYITLHKVTDLTYRLAVSKHHLDYFPGLLERPLDVLHHVFTPIPEVYVYSATSRLMKESVVVNVTFKEREGEHDCDVYGQLVSPLPIKERSVATMETIKRRYFNGRLPTSASRVNIVVPITMFGTRVRSGVYYKVNIKEMRARISTFNENVYPHSTEEVLIPRDQEQSQLPLQSSAIPEWMAVYPQLEVTELPRLDLTQYTEISREAVALANTTVLEAVVPMSGGKPMFSLQGVPRGVRLSDGVLVAFGGIDSDFLYKA